MKRLSLFAASFIFAALSASSAFAQAAGAPQTAGTTRIGIVNTAAFLEEKGGITKFRNAVNSVDAEFKTVNDGLQKSMQDYQTRVDEYKKLQSSTAPVNQTDMESKATAIQDLETRIKRDQEDAKARYERRYNAVVGPILADIGKALDDYAKQKGYAMLLDGVRLQDAQILLGFDPKYDVTSDFITFYNARPAGAATASTGATVPKQ